MALPFAHRCDLDGDGVTPVESALAWGGEGVEKLVVDGVAHFPWGDVFGGSIVAPELTEQYNAGMPWYGSEAVVEKWVGWLRQQAVGQEGGV